MKRKLLLAISCAVGLSISPFLPIYPHQSLVRAQVDRHAGDVISYRFSLESLFDCFDLFRYESERPSAWLLLGFDIVLALGLGVAIGAVIFFALARLATRRT